MNVSGWTDMMELVCPFCEYVDVPKKLSALGGMFSGN